MATAFGKTDRQDRNAFNWLTILSIMLNAHLPTGSRQLAISPTADWESAFVGRCVPNADPIVGANRRYSADSKFESALEPVGASR